MVVGILDMGEKFCSFTSQMHSSTEEVAGGAHRLRIDIGHGDHAASEQNGDFMGIDLVIFCLSAMDGFHIEGVSQYKGDMLLGTEIGDPVPGEDALNGHNDVFPESFDGFKKDLRVGSDIALKNKVSFLVEDAEVHGFCMKIDSAVVFVLLSVEIHIGLLC